MIIAGEFPAPMKLGNRNRWKQSVVYKWVEELQAITKKMAERTGVEPATSCVTGRRSNQLNYRSNFGGRYKT